MSTPTYSLPPSFITRVEKSSSQSLCCPPPSLGTPPPSALKLSLSHLPAKPQTTSFQILHYFLQPTLASRWHRRQLARFFQLMTPWRQQAFEYSNHSFWRVVIWNILYTTQFLVCTNWFWDWGSGQVEREKSFLAFFFHHISVLAHMTRLTIFLPWLWMNRDIPGIKIGAFSQVSQYSLWNLRHRRTGAGH